jgi:hypothetical protein
LCRVKELHISPRLVAEERLVPVFVEVDDEPVVARPHYEVEAARELYPEEGDGPGQPHTQTKKRFNKPALTMIGTL